jgi:hypothetical protein
MFFRRTVYARESIARPLTSSIGRWAVAVLFAFFIARPVAADVRVEEKQNPRSIKIHIFGKFIAKDFHQLDAMLEEIEKDRAPVGITVTLDSPGGAHFEGLRLGLLLQRKGIGTQILPGATSFSACASIFFGGFNRKTGRPNRVAHEGSRLGVHRASLLTRATDENERRLFAAAKLYFADMGVSEKIWRMFMETPPQDIYIVTPSDMTESNITFMPASKASAQLAHKPTSVAPVPPDSAPRSRADASPRP